MMVMNVDIFGRGQASRRPLFLTTRTWLGPRAVVFIDAPGLLLRSGDCAKLSGCPQSAGRRIAVGAKPVGCGVVGRDIRFLPVIVLAGVIGGAYPCGAEQRETGKEIEKRHEPDDRAEGGTRG